MAERQNVDALKARSLQPAEARRDGMREQQLISN